MIIKYFKGGPWGVSQRKVEQGGEVKILFKYQPIFLENSFDLFF